MQTVTMWRAFDAAIFESEEECLAHENNHPFLTNKRMVFYADNGAKILNPDEDVFLDSNAFVVYDSVALEFYITYCNRLHIAAPQNNEMDFPRHYKFYNGEWKCIEEELHKWQKILNTSFKNEYCDEENRHNLVDDGGRYE